MGFGFGLESTAFVSRGLVDPVGEQHGSWLATPESDLFDLSTPQRRPRFGTPLAHLKGHAASCFAALQPPPWTAASSSSSSSSSGFASLLLQSTHHRRSFPPENLLSHSTSFARRGGGNRGGPTEEDPEYQPLDEQELTGTIGVPDGPLDDFSKVELDLPDGLNQDARGPGGGPLMQRIHDGISDRPIIGSSSQVCVALAMLSPPLLCSDDDKRGQFLAANVAKNHRCHGYVHDRRRQKNFL